MAPLRAGPWARGAGAAVIFSLFFLSSYEAGILENPKVIDHGRVAATGPRASRVFAA